MDAKGNSERSDGLVALIEGIFKVMLNGGSLMTLNDQPDTGPIVFDQPPTTRLHRDSWWKTCSQFDGKTLVPSTTKWRSLLQVQCYLISPILREAWRSSNPSVERAGSVELKTRATECLSLEMLGACKGAERITRSAFFTAANFSHLLYRPAYVSQISTLEGERTATRSGQI